MIERDGYRLGRWGLDGMGRCLSCSETCAGVFEDSPGGWGERRLPVWMGDQSGPREKAP